MSSRLRHLQGLEMHLRNIPHIYAPVPGYQVVLFTHFTVKKHTVECDTAGHLFWRFDTMNKRAENPRRQNRN